MGLGKSNSVLAQVKKEDVALVAYECGGAKSLCSLVLQEANQCL